jgi:hypothetical protein
MTPIVTMRQALAYPDLLGGVLEGESWRAWRVLLIASCGEPLFEDEIGLFFKICGRRDLPTRRVAELVVGAARRR